jgi:broad specificity phosphatase PhoE
MPASYHDVHGRGGERIEKVHAIIPSAREAMRTPSMSTRITLIRHAAADTGSRLCGCFDVRLSLEGRRQLHALATRRRVRPAPDALFSSPLIRAQEVGALLAARWSLELHSANWAREIHCGLLEGMPLDQIRHRFADVWQQNEAQNDDTFAWPGGETYARFRARIVAGLRATASAHTGGRVAIVTHAGVISQVLGLIRQRPAAVWSEDRPAPLTGTDVMWTGNGPGTVVAFNDPDWF